MSSTRLQATLSRRACVSVAPNSARSADVKPFSAATRRSRNGAAAKNAPGSIESYAQPVRFTDVTSSGRDAPTRANNAEDVRGLVVTESVFVFAGEAEAEAFVFSTPPEGSSGRFSIPSRGTVASPSSRETRETSASRNTSASPEAPRPRGAGGGGARRSRDGGGFAAGTSDETTRASASSSASSSFPENTSSKRASSVSIDASTAASTTASITEDPCEGVAEVTTWCRAERDASSTPRACEASPAGS